MQEALRKEGFLHIIKKDKAFAQKWREDRRLLCSG